ncbi:chemotaxis MotB protein [Algimonas ampicilliniresistens]|uniref:Chemotaxis MotB protein n=1 Tax=Algimonas ampicilliniresistens TaxID=1298735 RepID=A0ABQ5VCB9_9PROT|nr:flagellar motor protein MotB [Algimonas ampicilliniresistens]GLQ24344.1 chemotaxis MotB protein [Algimonas ampicilliniresistens]
MSAEQPIIIIKRPKIVKADGHHGGAWKVAYADFVTAMMAFFLLMWLLNATTEDQRRGLADYFSPAIPIAAVSGGGADALNGESMKDAPALSVLSRTEQTSDREAGRPQDDMSKALEAALVGEAAELSDHISIRMSPEGLVIELTDRDSRPLFASGSADPSPVLGRLAIAVAQALDDVENSVKIVGHTDSSRYSTPRGYSNWELSSDRANVARRLIKDAGLPEVRITEVSGRAATMPLVDNPLDARNRRISITLLRSDG